MAVWQLRGGSALSGICPKKASNLVDRARAGHQTFLSLSHQGTGPNGQADSSLGNKEEGWEAAIQEQIEQVSVNWLDYML